KYMNRFEISGYNALYGSLNTEMNKQLDMFHKVYREAGAFDSYSPLYMNTRGRGIGGLCTFASGGYNGCCLAIGACGIALMPLSAVMQNDQKVFVNLMFDGDAVVKDKEGKAVALSFQSNYPANGCGKITVKEDCELALCIRNPKWCEGMTVNGEAVSEEYCVLDKRFSAGESIEVCMPMTFKTHTLNGKVAFTYGPLTLASDEQKCDRELKKPVVLENGFACQEKQAENGEIVRFECDLGGGDVLVLADYQSCGKKWLSDKPYMTVWFNGAKADCRIKVSISTRLVNAKLAYKRKTPRGVFAMFHSKQKNIVCLTEIRHQKSLCGLYRLG
ncbi:MAG: glycoside hydrolase family 127 protein, partial [Clostridia bacterium]|nr:glycoside hydrolase family 127 protein [Clostridia bacterium]